MLTLFIETCTERSAVAILDEDRLCFMAGLPFGMHHSRYLVPKLQEAFQHTGKTPQEIQLVVCGIGPGSYTGIRIGAAVAKTVSYTCAAPLVGVCTLQGFIPEKDGTFAAVIDAKMSGIFLLKGERKEGRITYTTPPETCPIESLGEKLDGIDTLVGPNFGALRGKILEAYPDAPWNWQETAPDPLHMLALAMEKFAKGEFSTDGSLELNYMR